MLWHFPENRGGFSLSIESHDSPDSVKLQSRKCIRGDHVTDCYFALGNEDVLGPPTVIEDIIDHIHTADFWECTNEALY